MMRKMRYLILLPSAANVFACRFRHSTEQSRRLIHAKESQWNVPAKVKGRQLPLLVEKEGRLVLEENNLEQLLCSKNVKDKPVAVISIAGAFRMGKSFTLNLFLRYFQKNAVNEWLMDDPWSRLDEGISWRGGAESHTTGIVAWSEPFLVRKSDGTEMAVILLDTQGNFDHGTRKEKSVRVFALSTLFSSLQIFNVSKQIQSNDLEHLKSFVEYSKLPIFDQKDNDENFSNEKKYFQDLLFLVRDWSNPNDYEFGAKGGKEYLTNLKLKSTNVGNVSVQHYLENTFENINCYLMPEPAEKVRITGDEGRPLIALDLGKKFAQHVENLAQEFISPDALAPKSIGYDVTTTGEDLFKHVKSCADVLFSREGPLLPGEMELIAAHNCEAQKEKVLTKYERIVLERIETAEHWRQFDDVIKYLKKEAKIQFVQNTWYGKGTISDLCGKLDESLSHLDDYLKTKMVERREKLVRENIEKWKHEYREKLQGRGWIHTSESTLEKTYEEALANLTIEDDRDPLSVKLLLKSAKEYIDKILDINKKDAVNSNFTKKTVVSAASAAGGVVAAAVAGPIVVIPFAAAAAGVWWYKKDD